MQTRKNPTLQLISFPGKLQKESQYYSVYFLIYLVIYVDISQISCFETKNYAHHTALTFHDIDLPFFSSNSSRLQGFQDFVVRFFSKIQTMHFGAQRFDGHDADAMFSQEFHIQIRQGKNWWPPWCLCHGKENLYKMVTELYL